MCPVPDDQYESQRLSYFQNYADYSHTLRAWLVAYGIGGPVLFVTNDKITEKVAKSGFANEIIVLFLIGVGLQILLSMINKWCAWHLYRGAGDTEYCVTRKYKVWNVINEQSWIDFWLDLASLFALGWATWRVLIIFLRLNPVA